MNTITDPKSGQDLDLLPPVNIQVKRLMLATTSLVDGYVQTMPEQWHPALENSMLLPLAGIMLVGTRCDRPLMIREVQNIARAVERDAIIVRACDGRQHATFDVIMHSIARPFLGYRLWVDRMSGSSWLVPAAGEPTHIQIGMFGLAASPHEPYFDEGDRQRGIKYANEFLSLAAQGWF